MSKRTEMAGALRASKERHYNCCQAVIIPFCDVCDIEPDTAHKIAAQFGGGMRVGSVCGALTGGVMVMGLLNRSEEEAKNFINEFKATNGHTECIPLLETATESCPREKLCNGLVCGSIEAIEKLMATGQ